MSASEITALLEVALDKRAALSAALDAEGTDAYRLFHGAAEGRPGLTVDRYGPLVLVQTFREPLGPGELEAAAELLGAKLSFRPLFAYNHRGKEAGRPCELRPRPEPAALAEFSCSELGSRFLMRARHRGMDPWLFLDLRAGRRFLRGAARGRSVLNLFSYTCGAGVSAAAAGAREVWNVDFSSSSLEVGRRNAELNGIAGSVFRTVEEDCLPVMRQLAGLPAGGRYTRNRRRQRFEPRPFDLVFLDPPAWSTGKYGAVDVAGDYPGLFKPAVLAARPGGGQVIATNHVPTVTLEAWLAVLEACARKAGRPLTSLKVLAPEDDFPSFDGRPPLKIAVCGV